MIQQLKSQNNSTEIAIRGYDKPIKKMNEADQNNYISAQLVLIAEAFGNRKEIDSFLLMQMVSEIKSEWAHYGIMEIFEAFRMWSKKEIKGSEMYGGEMNLLVLNRVLSDYENFRRDVLNKELAERRDKMWQELKRKHEAKEREVFDNITNEQLIEEVKKYDDLELIPKWLVNMVLKRGLIKDYESQKIKYIEYAKELAERQIIEDKAIAKAEKHGIELADELDRIITRKEDRVKYILSQLIIYNQINTGENHDNKNSN